MAFLIAVAGKGGVGKTTICSLLIGYLSKRFSPVLAIDADPNSNLHKLLGIEYHETIADIREETKELSSLSQSKSDFFDMRLQEVLVEGKDIDLLVMGRPEGSGCYCAVNNILREYILKLSRNYRYIVIDNEAGMEHLSRRTANNIDRLLLISDATIVGVTSAINAYNTAKKARLKIKETSLFINKLKTESMDEEKIKLIKTAGLTITGSIRYNAEIEKRSETGKDLAGLDIKTLDNMFSKLIS